MFSLILAVASWCCFVQIGVLCARSYSTRARCTFLCARRLTVVDSTSGGSGQARESAYNINAASSLPMMIATAASVRNESQGRHSFSSKTVE